MNAFVLLLWLMCAGAVANAFAADPYASEGESAAQTPSQPSSVAPPGAAVQSPAAPPSATEREATTTADPPISEKSAADANDAKLNRTATPPPEPQTAERKPPKNVLVDDTVNDAQLKQILAKGYKPTKQALGNEVSYCRHEQLAGERFMTTVCKTAARILEDEQRGKDLLNSMDRISQQTGGR